MTSAPLAPRDAPWAFISLEPLDATHLAEIRAAAMKGSLVHLGRYDETRVRQRFIDAFEPKHTWGMTEAGALLGCIAIRPEQECVWIEHFYLAPAAQGRGLGTDVLLAALASIGERTVRLNVLRESRARHLYERHGFVVEHEDPIDVFMVRRPPHIV